MLAYAPQERAAAVATAGGVTRDSVWAELMYRSFGFDVLACPRCGGRLRLIALIEEAQVIQRVPRHLGLPTEVTPARPARPPPIPHEEVDYAIGGDIDIP